MGGSLQVTHHSERFFSAAGLAFEDLRQAMSEGHLEHLMWAKFNVVKLQCRDIS